VIRRLRDLPLSFGIGKVRGTVQLIVHETLYSTAILQITPSIY
jgi:hypothetical protein